MSKNVRKRKLMLVLPLLVIPFLTMAFWALGGGSPKKQTDAAVKGLNLDLPDARLKEEKLIDKLGFYDKADKDSLKLEEWMRNDPYFKRDTVPDFTMPNEVEAITNNTSSKYGQRLNTSPYEKQAANPEDQIMRKLKLLQEELDKPTPTELVVTTIEEDEHLYTLPTEDPDIKQLNGALDKILDIQHPERVKERSVKNKDAVYAVRSQSGSDTLVKGFYSYSEEKAVQEDNAIESIIATNQIIVNGAVVKFRTLSEMFVNGKKIPSNTLISGIASLDGERLVVEISSIRCGNNIFSVKLEVYDMDGLAGIYIPGTINRDVAKESLNNSLSLADMTTLDPSFKAQATATGIGAVKSLVSKKTKLIRVQVKAGYKILLKNKNQDQ